ncbi:NAD(P)H-dependent oxidoreductase [Bacillus pumilus]
MNHLIIFAHPQQSLNQTLLDLVVSTLLNNGHKVTVRDVYALGFSPELSILEKAAIKQGDVSNGHSNRAEADSASRCPNVYFSYLVDRLTRYVKGLCRTCFF